MIRFACPGCGAPYTVAESKGGKAGKCLKCHVPFVIPLPSIKPTLQPVTPSHFSELQIVDAIPVDISPPAKAVVETPSAPPSPPPPPVPAGVEIAPCPGCQARLTVDPTDLGGNVECPYCKTIFAAIRPEAILPQLTKSKVIDAEVVSTGWSARDGGGASPFGPARNGPPENDAPAGGKIRTIVRKVGGTRTIARLGILSFAKMNAAIAFVAALAYALIYGVLMLFMFILGTSLGADATGMIGLGLGYVVCFLVVMPFLSALFGFIAGAIWALVYNLLAQMIGGVEVDLE